jgi:hypothetical protein
MAAQANRLGVFLHPRGRARNCVRKRRTHVTRWLRYGCERFGQRLQTVGALGVRDSLGAGRDRRVTTLPHFDFTIPGTVNKSQYVLCDGKHVEARNLTGSPV